jgi:DNA-binding transcriptional LysR family regulator
MAMAVAASPGYLAQRGVPTTPSALATHACLGLKLPTHDNLLGWEFKAANGKTLQVQPAGRLVSNEPSTLIRAACDGHGLVWLPRALLADEIAQGLLQTVLDEYAIAYQGYHLYYPARQVSPAMRLVIDALRLKDA